MVRNLNSSENALNAVKNEGITTVAIRGKDSVVVCTQKKVEDKLIVADSVTHIFSITDQIGAIVTGNMVDAKNIITRLKMQAAEFKFKHGYRIPVHVLVQKHSEFCQLSTQRVGMRTLCVVITIVGIDEEKGP